VTNAARNDDGRQLILLGELTRRNRGRWQTIAAQDDAIYSSRLRNGLGEPVEAPIKGSQFIHLIGLLGPEMCSGSAKVKTLIVDVLEASRPEHLSQLLITGKVAGRFL
jgi:hypothetical protein